MPATSLSLPAGVFAERLLAWFDQHGRHDLPWQQDITPYRVWVSEIMLQQTQVATVIPYFERFMQRFPRVDDLAAAPLDDVLHLWTGLGYYARGRNLHKAARQIVADFHDQLPDSLDALVSLAGIGRSTAGAILSIAYGQQATILDGNVKRVLTRISAIDSPPSSARDKQLWALAECFTPGYRNPDYTQAIMDLGATLCRRGQPNCSSCPFNDVCLGHKQGIAKNLPVGKKRKALPEKATFMLLLKNHAGEVLLEQRPPAGLWGGLWCPPQIDTLDTLPELFTRLGLNAFEGSVSAGVTGSCFRHTFSHFHLDVTPVTIEVTETTAIGDNRRRWVDPAQPGQLGLAAPVKKLLHKMVHTS